MDQKQRCSTCKFWDSDAKDHYDGDDFFSDCRRYPPIAVTVRDYMTDKWLAPGFPVTFEYDWCGEWQPLKRKT